MTKKLADGVYEHLVTLKLSAAIEEAKARGRKVAVSPLEALDGPDRLARKAYGEIIRTLESLGRKSEDDEDPLAGLARQIGTTNALISWLRERLPDDVRNELEVDDVDEIGRMLEAVHVTPEAPRRPTTGLSRLALLTGARHEPRLGAELLAEFLTADRVDAIVSFVKWRGWQQMRPGLEAFCQSGRKYRLLTTTYMGASDGEALVAMAGLPSVEIRISHDSRRTRLHAKAWLFERDSGLSTAYVGSANISAPALGEGLEWTLKVAEAAEPALIEKFRGAFDSLWEDPEFEAFDPSSPGDVSRLQEALRGSGNVGSGAAARTFFDLRPYPFQQAILDTLDDERDVSHHNKNLVVSATGTGKTMIAAFDYRRLSERLKYRPRLLFVAHRSEILEQAQRAFREVLRDGSFGDRLGGGFETASYDHVFANIQTLAERELWKSVGSDHWHYVVMDEIHRGAASSYTKVLENLCPKILLGLTATPERTDGQDILHFFGGKPAAEIRLWSALERGLLVPFDYYGLHDDVDLSSVKWARGGYDTSVLEGLYTGNDRRAQLIGRKFAEIQGSPRNARALGFCVSIAHAESMARKFTEAGIPSLALSGESPSEIRVAAPGKLVSREINVIFTCDLYNEGVDIPEVDTLLFLRPTESALLFQQQLGRGLRLAEGKTSTLVLDFIGQCHRKFRFSEKFRALTGQPAKALERDVQEGFPLLPPGCSVLLDKVSREIVLRNLRESLSSNLAALRRDLESVHLENPGVELTMSKFLEASGRSLAEVYRANIGGWTRLRRHARLLPASTDPFEEELNRGLAGILHVDDSERLNCWRRMITGAEVTEGEMRLATMLGYRLFKKAARPSGIPSLVSSLNRSPELTSELLELINLLESRLHGRERRPAESASWPFLLHRTYMRDEVLCGTGLSTLTAARTSREGVLFLPGENAELFFVTLNKSEKAFSPTTRYEDYAISQELFHWQSQSTTSEDHQTGRRYRGMASAGCRFFLFVREYSKNPDGRGEPFTFLGPVHYIRHHGSRPMNITWKLEVPIPAALVDNFLAYRAA